jgi:hypothetical protein
VFTEYDGDDPVAPIWMVQRGWILQRPVVM